MLIYFVSHQNSYGKLIYEKMDNFFMNLENLRKKKFIKKEKIL